MIIIFWSLLWVATVIFFISYIKMREGIPTYKRERFEKILMILLIIFLLIDIGFFIFERKELTMEMNDCIRFYRYFPNFYKDAEFYFIQEKCFEFFDEEGITRLRDSGLAWQRKQAEKNQGSLNLFGGATWQNVSINGK